MNRPLSNQEFRFQCTGCSKCCRHDPGFVFLTSKDILRLMKATGLAFREFLAKFTRTVDVGTGLAISLNETSRFDCVFWNDGCSVHSSRPLQCSTYPFWERIVESLESWQEEARDCPGMGRGSSISPETIDDLLGQRRDEASLIVPYGSTLETMNENTILGSTGVTTNSADSGET